jgi:hypothetical protein
VGVAGRWRRGGSGGEVVWWSRLIVREEGVAPGDGVVEGVLQVLRLGSAMATRSSGPSQSEGHD